MELQPKIQHTWRRDQTNTKAEDSIQKLLEPEKKNDDDQDDITELERLADLKLSGHTRDGPQTPA